MFNYQKRWVSQWFFRWFSASVDSIHSEIWMRKKGHTTHIKKKSVPHCSLLGSTLHSTGYGHECSTFLKKLLERFPIIFFMVYLVPHALNWLIKGFLDG